jgi:hypothetical protein
MKLYIVKVNGNLLKIVCKDWNEVQEKFKKSHGDDATIELVSADEIPFKA